LKLRSFSGTFFGIVEALGAFRYPRPIHVSMALTTSASPLG